MSEMVYGIIMSVLAIAFVALFVILVSTIVGALKKKEEKPLSLMDRIEFILKKDAMRNNGIVHDADTVLADIMQEADFEITGLGKEIFDIYKKTRDREAFENLFYSLSGETFEEYIIRCEKA